MRKLFLVQLFLYYFCFKVILKWRPFSCEIPTHFHNFQKKWHTVNPNSKNQNWTKGRLFGFIDWMRWSQWGHRYHVFCSPCLYSLLGCNIMCISGYFVCFNIVCSHLLFCHCLYLFRLVSCECLQLAVTTVKVRPHYVWSPD